MIKICTNCVAWTKNFNVLCTYSDLETHACVVYTTKRLKYLYIIGFREIYTKHRRSYTKLCRVSNTPNNNNTAAANNLTSSRIQLEKDYKLALQKQDQKIDLTKRMYDLVSRHIERIDSQMAKSDIGDVDWMGQASRKGSQVEDTNWRLDASARKRPSPHGALSVRKRYPAKKKIHQSCVNIPFYYY